MTTPKISVIIPVKNGEATLGKCLHAISMQKNIADIEVIIIDSGSTDRGREIGEKYGVQWIEIDPATFNHGGTRNLGVHAATGELLWFTVQDAYIDGTDMLERMAKHFEEEAVQSVAGMQAIPHDPDKNPGLWFRRSGEPEAERYQFDMKGFASLTAREQLACCRLDDVNAMYRKSALLTQPFEILNLSEDMVWAKAALSKGWLIIRDPSLLVWHYHHHLFTYQFRNKYAVFYTEKKYFNTLPVSPAVFMPLLRRSNVIRKRNRLNLSSKVAWMWHNAVMLFAHFLAVLVFRICNLFGQQTLDISYRYFCKIPIQGQLKIA